MSTLLRKSDLEAPFEPDRLFGRPGPLALEIGFGDGRYLVSLRRAHPDWNLLGVEVSLASVSRAFRRLRREGIGHTRIMKGNARFLVRDVLPDASLHRVFVNFPDPWPRKRHAANRLLQRDFFRLMSHRLAATGALMLTTDHREYFEFAQAEAEATGLYRLTLGSPPPDTLATKYALKWQEEERPIYHVRMDPLKRDVETHAPQIAQEPMQHALLDGDLDAVQDFSKVVHRFRGGTAIVTQAFRAMDGDGLLFQVVIEEPDLRQEVLVRAWRKSDGVFVGLQPFGDPMGTRGVREAVRAVTGWLVGQGMTVTKDWI